MSSLGDILNKKKNDNDDVEIERLESLSKSATSDNQIKLFDLNGPKPALIPLSASKKFNMKSTNKVSFPFKRGC